MDAGLAAVLGAAAGSLGTVISGILTRSQAKMQIKADHTRAVYEQRHSACNQFLESVETVHALITDVHANLGYRFANDAPIPGDFDVLMDTAMERAQTAMAQASSDGKGLRKLYAAVAVLGPELQAAAASAVESMAQDLEHTQRWVVAENDGWDDCDDYENPATEAHARAADCNIAFSRSASTALGRDGLGG